MLGTILCLLQQVSFEPLGTSIGATNGLATRATAVSATGSIVVGVVETSLTEFAVRWHQTGSGEILLIPQSGGYVGSRAHGVSANGAIVVGDLLLAGGSTEAAVWGPSFGILRPLPGVVASLRAVSAGGTYAAGMAELSPGISLPIRVDLATGTIDWIAPVGGTIMNGVARALSAAGRVVGGDFLDAGGRPNPFIWTPQDGARLVPLPGGNHLGSVTTVSAFEHAIAGYYFLPSGTAGGSPSMGGWTAVFANGLSSWNPLVNTLSPLGTGYDNLRIDSAASHFNHVGMAFGSAGQVAYFDAVPWTHSIQQFLVLGGAQVPTGWQLTEGTAVSADKNWIVGNGTNPSGKREAWRAYMSLVYGVGVHSCLSGTPNSAGFVASTVGVSYVTPLTVLGCTTIFVPVGSIGYYVAGQVLGGPTVPLGSIGSLCLAGNITRINGPGQVRVSNGQIAMSTLNIPAPLAAAQPGEQWHFQLWYRDVINGLPTSAFSDALTVTMQ